MKRYYVRNNLNVLVTNTETLWNQKVLKPEIGKEYEKKNVIRKTTITQQQQMSEGKSMEHYKDFFEVVFSGISKLASWNDQGVWCYNGGNWGHCCGSWHKDPIESACCSFEPLLPTWRNERKYILKNEKKRNQKIMSKWEK